MRRIICILVLSLVCAGALAEAESDSYADRLSRVSADPELRSSLINDVNSKLEGNALVKRMIPKGEVYVVIEGAEGPTAHAVMTISGRGKLTSINPGDARQIINPGDHVESNINPGDASPNINPGDATPNINPGDASPNINPGDAGMLINPGDINPGDWDYKITAKESTLRKLSASEDPLAGFVVALKSNDIVIESSSVVGKVKIGLMKIGVRIAAMLRR